MDQGRTQINGPHQGAWVELDSGESWFIHFQDRGGYGRITHLQPMHWVDDWPMIGNDPDDDGKGEPVLTHRKPDVGKAYPAEVPQTSDNFNSPKIGLQWQWAANFKDEWYSLSARPGWLRLFAVPKPAGSKNIMGLPNVLLQKMPGPEFTVTTKLNVGQLATGEKAGLVVLGGNYSFIGIERTAAAARLIKVSGDDHENDAEEGTVSWSNDLVILRVKVTLGPSCEFSYSVDGRNFATLGKPLAARAAGWSGARVGLFCSAPENAENTGHFDVDWFRFEK
jgi:beta-xylosidase